jgi:hypothetical protein
MLGKRENELGEREDIPLEAFRGEQVFNEMIMFVFTSLVLLNSESSEYGGAGEMKRPLLPTEDTCTAPFIKASGL